MSTRIYQGFRMETESLTEVLNRVESFRPWVTTQAEATMDQFIQAVEGTGMTAGAAYKEWLDRRRELQLRQHRDPFVDTEFSVWIRPVPGAMLGIVYTEHKAWFEAWCAQAGVREYGYWDNADPPEDMSEEEWTARAQAWAFMLVEPVSMQGFAIEVVSPNGPRPKAWRHLG